MYFFNYADNCTIGYHPHNGTSWKPKFNLAQPINHVLITAIQTLFLSLIGTYTEMTIAYSNLFEIYWASKTCSLVTFDILNFLLFIFSVCNLIWSGFWFSCRRRFIWRTISTRWVLWLQWWCWSIVSALQRTCWVK